MKYFEIKDKNDRILLLVLNIRKNTRWPIECTDDEINYILNKVINLGYIPLPIYVILKDNYDVEIGYNACGNYNFSVTGEEEHKNALKTDEIFASPDDYEKRLNTIKHRLNIEKSIILREQAIIEKLDDIALLDLGVPFDKSLADEYRVIRYKNQSGEHKTYTPEQLRGAKECGFFVAHHNSLIDGYVFRLIHPDNPVGPCRVSLDIEDCFDFKTKEWLEIFPSPHIECKCKKCKKRKSKS